MNKKEKGTGDAKRSFGKLLGNATYGQTLKRDHDDVIAFINNVKAKDEFLTDNILREIVVNEEDPEGFHTFIGTKIIDHTKQLTSRSVFLGAFVLSYSRKLVCDIVNIIYGSDRYTTAGLKQQIYYGDTDSLLMHRSQAEKLINAGWFANVNGKLTDDLNKNAIKNNGEFEFAKVIEYIGVAPKSYALKYITPDGQVKDKIKLKGISQGDFTFENGGEVYNKFTFDLIKHVYNERHNENSNRQVTMPNRLKKNKYNINNTDKTNGIKQYSIHTVDMVRTLFNTEWAGRRLEGDIFVPYQ